MPVKLCQEGLRCSGAQLAIGSIKFCGSISGLAQMTQCHLRLFAILEYALMLPYPCGHMWRRQSRAASPFYVIFAAYDVLCRNHSRNHSTSLSRLGYGNATFAGPADQSLVQLLSVLTATVRLILLSRKSDHVTSLPRQSHSLRIPCEFHRADDAEWRAAALGIDSGARH